ncbi:MAG: IS1634 family transposase, partial [candidate division NC10 bacterium]
VLVESVATPKGPRQRVICSLGALAPGPREEWLGLAHKLGASLQGQLPLGPDPQLATLVGRVRPRRRAAGPPPASVAVDPDRVAMEDTREAGPVHVGHQVWRQLGLDSILRAAGLSERACTLTEAMTLNRLIFPLSEHAMAAWIPRTALGDILGTDFAALYDEVLYRNLDRLHPQRAPIERALAARERTLFHLDGTLYLYDLTSTYFEGQAKRNPLAQRGYSRDKRPDCKQVLVGRVLDWDGFPQAHEGFAGNRQDRQTVGAMLDSLAQRVGAQPGATVVVDRGMAYAENLAEIRARGLHYLVAARQPEREPWLAEFAAEDGWEDVPRTPSPRNPGQHKTRVEIKRRPQGDEVVVLCWSEGREAKDQAIREKQDARLRAALTRLQGRIAAGRLKAAAKIQQAIGRLRERYPRVARSYAITYDAAQRQLTWTADEAAQAAAATLDGGYLLKTDRPDLTADEIWRTYILLTRVEAAFRAMKSPLMERPIFHQLQHRVETHLFLCVLAYHLLVAIEKRFLDRGSHTSWWTLRQELSTHQVGTVVLPTPGGKILKIRKGGTPEARHREIYKTLGIPLEVMKPVKAWHGPAT